MMIITIMSISMMTMINDGNSAGDYSVHEKNNNDYTLCDGLV